MCLFDERVPCNIRGDETVFVDLPPGSLWLIPINSIYFSFGLMRARLRLSLFVLAFVLLGAIGLPLLLTGGVISCGRGPRVQADIRFINSELERFKEASGHYPTTAVGLRAIPHAPKDPWNTNYIYRIPGTRHPNSYDLFSAGLDRTADTADDYWSDK